MGDWGWEMQRGTSGRRRGGSGEGEDEVLENGKADDGT